VTIATITLRCNGPLTDRGPISRCDATFEAHLAGSAPLARRQAAAKGWTIHRPTHLPVGDLCPIHAPDARATGA
jgi:hypothetical protein